MTDDPTTPEEPQIDEPKGSREARYRTQLREAEAARDALQEKLAGLQRSTVEGIIERDVRVSSAGVFAAKSLEDFLNDDGDIDAETVADIARSTAEELGLQIRSGTPRADPSQGGKETGNSVTWDSFMKS